MAAGFSLRLRHVGLSRNPEAPMRQGNRVKEARDKSLKC
jgi:hypothetical protein